MASHTGKILSAKIIAPGAQCMRLQDMCNARAYPRSEPLGRTLAPQSRPGSARVCKSSFVVRRALSHLRTESRSAPRPVFLFDLLDLFLAQAEVVADFVD